MKSYTLNIIFFLFSISIIYAQSVNEVLDLAYKKYSKSESLQFNTEYNLYKTATATDIFQSYVGKVYKKGKATSFMVVNNTEILSTPEISLKVNHGQKAILIANPEGKLSEELDLTQLLLVYDKEGIKDLKTYWEVSLKSKKITTEPYYRIILHISKEYRLLKQVFFYANKLDFSKDYKVSDLSQPRLEIIYSAYNTKKIETKTFSSVKYIKSITPSNIILSKKLEGYELMDKREFSNKIHTKK